MARAEINMTEGNLWRQIFRYSVPLMFSNVLQVLFHMSDIAVVGRFSGPTALGAVGSTAILVTLFTGFIMGVSSGVNATAARYMGAQRHQDTRETVIRLSLRRGEMLILVSDGAEIGEHLRHGDWGPLPPGELAERLVKECRTGGGDDATVAVLRLSRRQLST